MKDRREYLKKWHLDNKEKRKQYFQYYHIKNKLDNNQVLTVDDHNTIKEYEESIANKPPKPPKPKKIKPPRKCLSPEEKKLKRQTYRKENKDRLNTQRMVQYYKNKEPYKESNSRYRERNKEKCRLDNKNWAKNNRPLRRASGAKYKATKLKQTPKWADLKAIKEFYKKCPDGYEVDHIIPLQGENVRGLHVLENLQYLTKSENSSKRNKF